MDRYLRASSVIFVAPVVAFGLGYAYFVGYFGFFGLQITSLAIPPEHFFVKGVLSFLYALAPENLGQAIPLVSLAVLLTAVVIPFERLGRFRNMIAWIAVVPLLAGGVYSAFHQGQNDGREVAGGQQVFVHLGDLAGGGANPADLSAPSEDGWAQQQAALARANASGLLRPIWQDAERTIVGARVCEPGDASVPSCYWSVYNLSFDAVSATATITEEPPAEAE